MNSKLLKTFLFILLGITIVWSIFNKDSFDIQQIQSSIENTGTAAPLIFIFIYIASTVLFLPGSLLTLLGGALFGPVMGTFYSLTAATLGAMLSFLVARYLASDWVAKKSAGRMQQLIKGVENEGWRFVAFTRLVPLFPFNLLNYALGLTKISFTQYSIATYIFMLPGALAYTYLGYIGKEAATGGEDLIHKALFALSLLAIVAFIPRVIQSFRKQEMLDVVALKEQLEAPDKKPVVLDVRNISDYHGEQGHIPGSTLVPLEQLTETIDKLNIEKQQAIVTICRTDRRSSQAAKILIKMGFSSVKVVRMGMTDWNRHQFPVEH